MVVYVYELSSLGAAAAEHVYHINSVYFDSDKSAGLLKQLKNPIVQADGDELDSIIEQFPNIVRAKKRVVTWRGDLAWFILDNWEPLKGIAR